MSPPASLPLKGQATAQTCSCINPSPFIVHTAHFLTETISSNNYMYILTERGLYGNHDLKPRNKLRFEIFSCRPNARDCWVVVFAISIQSFTTWDGFVRRFGPPGGTNNVMTLSSIGRTAKLHLRWNPYFSNPQFFEPPDNSLKLSLAFSGPAFSFSWEEAVMHAFNTRPFSSPKGLLQCDVGGA